MDPQKEKELEEAYEKAVSYIFHKMPMSQMDIDSVIAENAMIYGTTVDENVFGIDDFKSIMNMQAKELEGLEPSFERIPVFQHVSDDGTTGLFIEEVKMTIHVEDTISVSNVRMTFVMENIDGAWKLIHAHGSKPVESEEDPWHVKEWEAEKEKLEKKVAEQTSDLQQKNRELEIEAASERVRAVAMSMQNPEEILDVLQVVKDEITWFEFGNVSTWMWTIQDDKKVSHWELADHFFEGGLDALNATFDPSKADIPKSFMEKMGSDFFSFHYKDDQILTYLDDVTKVMGPEVAEEEAGKSFKEAVESGKITNLWQQCSTFEGGLIGLMFVAEPSENVKQVLIKITDAFGMAYQRFKDLQEAERRRKEAELEAAVERVRAHAMGMQKPDDIMNVLNVMKEEVDKFELGNIATWIWTKGEDGLITQWDISEVIEEGNLVNFNLRFDIHDINKNPEVNRHTKEWVTGKEYYTLNWKGEDLQALVDEVAETDPESGKMFQEAVDVGQIKDYWHAASPFSRGVVGLDFTSTPPEITESILLKMSSAFDMAYQRFEDLKKAEAQAREAKIETALERIRSQALAMQTTDELRTVADVLYEQMRELGQPLLEGSAIHFYEKHDDNIEAWYTMPSGEQSGNLSSGKAHFPKEACWVSEEWIRKYQSDEKSYEIITSVSQQKEWLEALKDHASDIGSIASIDDPQPTHMHFVDFFGGALAVVSPDPVSEDTKTLQKRAASVFDFAYRRYEDLKKAEKQAYESKVEASLERVRGMASAMNHSDDLMQIAEEMFKELEILKINPLRYGLGMIDGVKKEAELWASTVNDGHYLDMLGTLSLTWHPMLQQALDAWDAQHEEMIYELKGKERSDYYRKIGQVNPVIPNLETLQDPKADITEFVSFFPFKSGALYAFTNGEPGEDGKSILKRFASVFEQAYIRYNDLQKAEKQARLIREERDRLEITLKELRATQDQLVQQEKLASLGQLTAGIAHEIKNPLNFVNNFSELSVELIEEAREEVRWGTGDGGPGDSNSEKNNSPLKKGDRGGCSSTKKQGVSGENQAPSLLLDILDDIEGNLKTIHKHGTRADSIVKSMLQHSRGGDGKLESTPLNPLIKEYANLAFHGMRAGKDPINVDIDLQLDENVGEVPLIAEDFSRVILNLCNNAFDAMRDKQTGDGGPGTEKNSLRQPAESAEAERRRGVSGYAPKLSIRTKSSSNSVTIDIEDNGPGIPDEIKDKILQPFFTTKKGTSGTGLGLSITNDIIKAHGGQLDIESNETGSRFTIQLNKRD